MKRHPRRIRRLRDNERGMMLVFAGLGLIAFMSASALALDVGMFMAARSQSQAAADAGALAGAVALVYDNWDDRSAAGPAVQSAIKAATNDSNAVMSKPVSVLPGDVTFPAIDKVRVRVQRTAGRGNPLLPFIAPMFGVNEVDMGAVATAQAAPANAMTCVKPFTIPDRWEEHQTGAWDPEDSFDLTDDKGNPIANPDVYIPVGTPGYTGYDSQRDRGVRVTIKASNDSKLYPSFYYPFDINGETGADPYRWNIANCNTTILKPQQLITTEPGNMVGPTKQGIADLVALDPDAYWDETAQKPVSKMHPSPRVVTIPVFDPVYYYTGKMNGKNADLKVANFIGIFIEGMVGDEVVARITPVPGILNGSGPAPQGMFPKVIVLVQ
jgi:Flp pilus assembly protein TadG